MAFFLFLFLLLVFICSEKNGMSDKRILESDEFSNIRIYVDYNCLISSQNTTDNNLLKRAIENAKKTIEKLVKVKRLQQKIYLPNYNIRYDKPSDLNEKYDGCTNKLNEIDADLVIFIREYSQLFDGVLDFARSEIMKHITDNDMTTRPLIGGIAFAFNVRSLPDEDSKFQAISTIFLHEFTHILGFNKTILEKNNLIKNESFPVRMRKENITKSFVIGDNVVKTARKYFNCTSMNGVELDVTNGLELNDGNSIHWNARILMGDYMIPELYYSEQAISEITL